MINMYSIEHDYYDYSTEIRAVENRQTYRTIGQNID